MDCQFAVFCYNQIEDMPKVKCEFCGAYIDASDEKCPNCGAVNVNYRRFTDATPKTIEELKEWYMARKLPPERVTRFFIGKDVKEPKAFGIYKDGRDIIVYKNKANGQRSVRYQGKDEAYGVNELYMKLKSEILNQKNHRITKKRRSSRFDFDISSPSGIFMIIAGLIALSIIVSFLASWAVGLFGILLTGLIVFFRKDVKKMIISIALLMTIFSVGGIAYYAGVSHSHRNDGYYTCDDTYYYVQGNDVYYYDTDDWYYYDSYDDFTTYYPDYDYVGQDYNYNETYSDFSDSYYYEDWDSSSSSSSSSYSNDWSSDSDYDWDYNSYWDSDSDWDSGWDSSDSDWDSDW